MVNVDWDAVKRMFNTCHSAIWLICFKNIYKQLHFKMTVFYVFI